MIRRPPRSTRTDNSFPTRRSSDLDANGQVRALFGRKIEGLSAELPAVAPRVSGAQALASAKRAALGSRLLAMRVQAEKSRQVVFVGDDGRAHMAWEVSFFADSARGGSPTSPLVIVDAASGAILRSEEHTSELQSLMRISYAVFCLQ